LACFSACCCHRSGAGFSAELACRGPSAIWVPGWVVGFDSHEMAAIGSAIWLSSANHQPTIGGRSHEEVDET
jgi:hypothetical protein